MRTGSVYALCTPEGTPFYVGATVQSVGTRIGQHLRDARYGRPGSEVHELLAETGRVGVWILQSGIPASELGARERRHTFALERAGHAMLTYHHGANGLNRHSENARARIAAFAAKRPRRADGSFLPALPVMAGGAPTASERFWSEP